MHGNASIFRSHGASEVEFDAHDDDDNDELAQEIIKKQAVPEKNVVIPNTGTSTPGEVNVFVVQDLKEKFQNHKGSNQYDEGVNDANDNNNNDNNKISIQIKYLPLKIMVKNIIYMMMTINKISMDMQVQVIHQLIHHLKKR